MDNVSRFNQLMDWIQEAAPVFVGWIAILGVMFSVILYKVFQLFQGSDTQNVLPDETTPNQATDPRIYDIIQHANSICDYSEIRPGDLPGNSWDND